MIQIYFDIGDKMFIEGPRVEASCKICKFSSIQHGQCRRLSPPFPDVNIKSDWCGHFSAPLNAYEAKTLSITMPGEQNKLKDILDAKNTANGNR